MMPKLADLLWLRNFVLGLCLALTISACDKPGQLPQVAQAAEVQQLDSVNAGIEQAFAKKQSDVQVSGEGVVVKLLADDTKGAQHQKFLVKINPRQTLLFAHNIDLAARVPLQVGDAVSFSGEYVYNPKGGVVHWTHHDPRGQHAAGWIMLRGNKYQ
jgi:hypothetical protein